MELVITAAIVNGIITIAAIPLHSYINNRQTRKGAVASKKVDVALDILKSLDFRAIGSMSNNKEGYSREEDFRGSLDQLGAFNFPLKEEIIKYRNRHYEATEKERKQIVAKLGKYIGSN